MKTEPRSGWSGSGLAVPRLNEAGRSGGRDGARGWVDARSDQAQNQAMCRPRKQVGRLLEESPIERVSKLNQWMRQIRAANAHAGIRSNDLEDDGEPIRKTVGRPRTG